MNDFEESTCVSKIISHVISPGAKSGVFDWLELKYLIWW
jgi:hypothetical protein